MVMDKPIGLGNYCFNDLYRLLIGNFARGTVTTNLNLRIYFDHFIYNGIFSVGLK